MSASYEITPRCIVQGIIKYSLYQVDGSKSQLIANCDTRRSAESMKAQLVKADNQQRAYATGSGAAVVCHD